MGSKMAQLTLKRSKMAFLKKAPHLCLLAYLCSLVHPLAYVLGCGGVIVLETSSPPEVWAVCHLPFLYHDAQL